MRRSREVTTSLVLGEVVKQKYIQSLGFGSTLRPINMESQDIRIKQLVCDSSFSSGTPHCVRRVDRNLHYPEDLNGCVHHDGQVWSRALWDMRNKLGHVRAETIILEAQFSFPHDASMPAAAEEIVNPTQNLYGLGVAHAVRAAFEARSILRP